MLEGDNSCFGVIQTRRINPPLEAALNRNQPATQVSLRCRSMFRQYPEVICQNFSEETQQSRLPALYSSPACFWPHLPDAEFRPQRAKRQSTNGTSPTKPSHFSASAGIVCNRALLSLLLILFRALAPLEARTGRVRVTGRTTSLIFRSSSRWSSTRNMTRTSCRQFRVATEN